MDMSTYRVSETLKNGLPVTVRAIRSGDKDALREGFRGLEAQTIYLRFFHIKKDLTDDELRWATEVDFRRKVALVACVEERGQDRIIGTARYIAEEAEEPFARAEVAFVVEEDFQGLGLGGLLLRHLAVIGRSNGISTFHAVVLPENRSMQAVFERSGFGTTQRMEEGQVQVTLALREASE